MNKLLTKLKLLKESTIELPVEKYNFIAILKSQVDEKDLGFFSDMGDVFSSSKTDYKGHINSYGFELKKKRKFFDYNMNFAKAKGRFNQQGELLQINVEINGFTNQMIPFYIIVPIFYLFFILMTLQEGFEAAIIAFPFLLIHGLLMLGLPYFFMRRSVKRMKYDLERDFYFMLKK